jgi:hypothetical protein
MPPTLTDRLRGGDATALLELAHATHPRALAVARASAWSDDPESLLLDAYVALWLRRADAPAAGAEAWALAEVLAYCARRAARRRTRRGVWAGVGIGGAGRGVRRAARVAAGAVAGAAAWAAARVCSHLTGPRPMGRSAS